MFARQQRDYRQATNIRFAKDHAGNILLQFGDKISSFIGHQGHSCVPAPSPPPAAKKGWRSCLSGRFAPPSSVHQPARRGNRRPTLRGRLRRLPAGRDLAGVDWIRLRSRPGQVGPVTGPRIGRVPPSGLHATRLGPCIARRRVGQG